MEDNLKDVLNSLGKNLSNKEKEYYKEHKNKTLDEFTRSFLDQDNKGPEEFKYAVNYRLEQFQKGLIKSTLSESRELVWLYLNYNFVKLHFQKLISKQEGFVCCADKSRYIVDAIALFFKDGTKIMQEPAKEDDYFRTKLIFDNHDWIINFFNALHSLSMGDYEKYLEQLKDTINISNLLIDQNQSKDGKEI